MTFFSLIFLTYVISSKIVAVCSYCSEDIGTREILIPVPAYRDYDDVDDYGEAKVKDTKTEYVTISTNVTCKGVTFPLEFHGTPCEDCVRMLTITSLNTFVVPPIAFQKVSDYDGIKLNNLGIENIMPSAFSGHVIKQLYLSGNKLTEVGVGIFNPLLGLKLLDLSYNKISKISDHSFLGLTHLESLILSNNQLTAFSLSLLDPNIADLKLLDISYNIISSFPTEIKINIEKCVASGNKFKSIDFCLLNFKELYLSNNLIDKISTQNCNVETPVVKILDLSQNKISDLETFYFKNASKLENLNLGSNNISVIPVDFFYHTPFLTSLNLSHNKLEYFQHGTFDYLIHLEYLDLSYNNLSIIKNFFLPLVELVVLDVEHNQIKYINPEFYYDLPHLQKICFEHNNMNCDNLIDIFRLTNLKEKVNRGTTTNSSNIHGIACSESSLESSHMANNESNKSNIEQIFSNILNDMRQKNLDNANGLKEYFESDFKNSNFYKFMQTFQNSHAVKLNDTELFKYFNSDFENSRFYRYLESLKDTTNITNFKKQISDITAGLKNSSLTEYLDDLKKYKASVNDDFLKSDMYNYFNKNFEKSQFYKYLEHLSSVNKASNPEFAKLVNDVDIQKSEYNKLVASNIINSFFIVVMCFLLGILVYKHVFGGISKKRESLELIQGEI